jgi:hypothetical protein
VVPSGYPIYAKELQRGTAKQGWFSLPMRITSEHQIEGRDRHDSGRELVVGRFWPVEGRTGLLEVTAEITPGPYAGRRYPTTYRA